MRTLAVAAVALAEVAAAAPRVPAVTVRTIQQDAGCFVEGFVWDVEQRVFFQSCGRFGVPSSTIRMLDEAGGLVKSHALACGLCFAEGLALVDDKLVQLTWLDKLGFVYSRTADESLFADAREWHFAGEGWGFTAVPDGAGSVLAMSNGTNVISFYDPNSLERLGRELEVTEDGQPVIKINELEYVNGDLWANVWQTPDVVVIDLSSGAVKWRLDCAAQGSEQRSVCPSCNHGEKILNGIAHDASSGKVWVTGKNWNRIFEISYQDPTAAPPSAAPTPPPASPSAPPSAPPSATPTAMPVLPSASPSVDTEVTSTPQALAIPPPSGVPSAPTGSPTVVPTDGPAVPPQSGAQRSERCLRAATVAVAFTRRVRHDTEAATQGFAFDPRARRFYESIGGHGTSRVRMSSETDVPQLTRDIPGDDFAQGVTVALDKVFLLTWRGHKGYVYTVDLHRLGTFPVSGEGWGIAAWSTGGRTVLVMSNGTSTLQFYNAEDMSPVHPPVVVTDAGEDVSLLGELEVVDGLLWANVASTNKIAVISLETGEVQWWMDASGVKADVMQQGNSADISVLYGIAYDEARGEVWLTGKRWPRAYLISKPLRQTPVECSHTETGGKSRPAAMAAMIAFIVLITSGACCANFVQRRRRTGHGPARQESGSDSDSDSDLELTVLKRANIPHPAASAASPVSD
eukprot:TRINITY_DN39372_c0_g1_i1.p1 TRINITY_DN39372_c0_g1~~TRINITY_DN39372_c0_g1_i1.p1  ORF type:complete len:686 (+),score=145.63 TRINITY_DN39372_c0_g1_i1:60-2117(+)